MKRIIVYVFCLCSFTQLSELKALESSDDFKLYTNAKEAPEDNSANEDGVMANETPVGDGLSALILFAGLYGIVCCYRKLAR